MWGKLFVYIFFDCLSYQKHELYWGRINTAVLVSFSMSCQWHVFKILSKTINWGKFFVLRQIFTTWKEHDCKAISKEESRRQHCGLAGKATILISGTGWNPGWVLTQAPAKGLGQASEAGQPSVLLPCPAETWLRSKSVDGKALAVSLPL